MFNILNKEALKSYYAIMVEKPTSQFNSPWILQRCMAIIKSQSSSYHRGNNHVLFCSEQRSYADWGKIINIRNGQIIDFTGRRGTNEQILHKLLHQYVICKNSDANRVELVFTEEDIAALNQDIQKFLRNAAKFIRNNRWPEIVSKPIKKEKKTKQEKQTQMQNGTETNRGRQKSKWESLSLQQQMKQLELERQQYQQQMDDQQYQQYRDDQQYQQFSTSNNSSVPVNNFEQQSISSLDFHLEGGNTNIAKNIIKPSIHREEPFLNLQELGLNKHQTMQLQYSKNQDFDPQEIQEQENNQLNKLAGLMLKQKQMQDHTKTATKREDGINSEVMLYLHSHHEAGNADQHKSPSAGGLLSKQDDLQGYFQIHQTTASPSLVPNTKGKQPSQQIQHSYPPSQPQRLLPAPAAAVSTAHRIVQMDREENCYMNSFGKESTSSKANLVFDIYERQDKILASKQQTSRIQAVDTLAAATNELISTDMINQKLFQMGLRNTIDNPSSFTENDNNNNDDDAKSYIHNNLSLDKLDIEGGDNSSSGSRQEINMSFTNFEAKEEVNNSNENNDEDFNDDIKDEEFLDNNVISGEYNSDDNPQGDNSEFYQALEQNNQQYIYPQFQQHQQHHQSHSLGQFPNQSSSEMMDIIEQKHFPSSEKYLQSISNNNNGGNITWNQQFSQQQYTEHQQNNFNYQQYQNSQQQQQQINNPFIHEPLLGNYPQQGMQAQPMSSQQSQKEQESCYGFLQQRQSYPFNEQLHSQQQQQQQQKLVLSQQQQQQQQCQPQQQQQQQSQQQSQPLNYYALFRQQQEMNQTNQASQQLFTHQNR